jgi:hypothetical protein
VGAALLLALGCGMLIAGRAAGQGPAAAQNPPGASQEKEKKPAAAEVPVPLPRGKRLMLKDGTFQVVRSYERQGDRVRFYSVERSAWEEVPADLVDWDATSKAAAEDAKKREEWEAKARERVAAERAAEIDVGTDIEVTPGNFLPENEGLYAIQDKMILPLVQTISSLKLSKGQMMKQILVPVPVIPTKQMIQIAGKRAVVRLSTPQPEFYFRTDGREPEMELIRAKVKGDMREVGVVLTDIVGNQDEKRDYIPMQRWQVAKGVYRFTISQSLEPGEYAMGEIMPEGMNLYVWDFGVDPPGTRPTPAAAAAKKPAKQ